MKLCSLIVTLTMSLSALIVGAGCNVFGYAAHAVAGEERVDAVFMLPKRSTVVIAEKYSNPSQTASDDEPLARYVTEELREHNAAVGVIDPASVYTFRRSMPPDKFRAMTIDAVGRAVGAEQVLYVNIMSCEVLVAPGSEMLKGQAEVLVRLVDSQSGATIWPSDAQGGWPVGVGTPMVRKGESLATESAVRTDLLRRTGDRIGKLFYSYERP